MSSFDPAARNAPSPEFEAALRLSLVRGIGPRLRQALLARFGSAEDVFRAAPSELREVPGIGPKLASEVAAADRLDVAGELEVCRHHGIRLVDENADEYPRPLKTLPDPPGVLFVRGAILPADALAVAIVGSRHATRYGLEQAERLAGSLARAGLAIVSGLARGVDAAAHRGALAAGGRTIAVLGGGLAEIYPPEHAGLADQVAAQGALLSEQPPRMEPFSGMFPQRNRLISGLSLGVIVIEAALRSGALITARHAAEQGREVFALPGRVDNRLARGCHQLIREGATLVETADDVLAGLGHLVEAAKLPDGRSVHHPAELALNDVERQVLDRVPVDGVGIDQLIEEVGLPAHQVLAATSALEIRRLIRRLSGQQLVRL